MLNDKIYAYMRVSTEKQDLSRQENAIEEWCALNKIEIPPYNIFADKISGKTFKREQYIQLKSILKSGDILVVKELDRFGRNWDAIKEEWETLTKNGIKIIIIDMPMLSAKTNDTIDNRLIRETMFNMLCYLAQKERDKISQRTKEGLVEARKRLQKENKDLGRPSKINEETVDYLVELYNNKDLSINEISSKINMHRSQVFKIIKELIENGKIEPRNKRKNITILGEY